MSSYKNFQNERKKNAKSSNLFNKPKINSETESKSKTDRILEGVAAWTSFYRSNPHRFVKDYLGINLKLFQQILIYMMMHNNYFMYLASRGQGLHNLPINSFYKKRD